VNLATVEQLPALRKAFDRAGCVRLPACLDGGLFDQIAAGVASARFRRRDHGRIGTEACMEANTVLARLLFLANGPRLFTQVRAISGCGEIGCFDGRVYRLDPSAGHRDSWHSDLGDHRLVAMSVNLSSEPYAGGALQIRDTDTRTILHEEADLRPGDGVVFRLAERLEHRVTPVEGAAPRTTFAGWFKSRPTFLSVIRGEGWSA
jgi:hypothetical protein